MDELLFLPVKDEQGVRALCLLAERIWRQHFTPIIGSGQVDYMLQKFQSPQAVEEQLSQGYLYWLFLHDGAPVGYTGVHPEPAKLFLSKLYLEREQRGKGYARRAMNFLEATARAHGENAIWLTVNRYNESTIAVYRHLGFQTVREQKTDIGGGFFMDDFVMEKKL